jgi:hypothetical protein
MERITFHSDSEYSENSENSETNKPIRDTVEYNKLNNINMLLFNNNETHPILVICCIVISLIISILSSLPYATYSGMLLSNIWVLFCVVRPAMYAFIFYATWCKLLVYIFIENKTFHKSDILRYFVDFLFASIYSILYSIKWFELNDIYARYVTVTLFAISWFIVYYEVMDKHMITKKSTDSINHRRRKILLLSIKKIEQLCWDSVEDMERIYNKLNKRPHISVLIYKHKNSEFYHDEEGKLSLYENDYFDPWYETRSNIVNVLLGFSLILLILSIIEDYGYSLHRLVDNNDIFLWLVLVLCSILSCLYLVATFPIYHNTLKFLVNLFTKREWKQITSLIRRLPFSFLGCISALTRANSSYSIFGKIAAKMIVPTHIGLFLIWTATAIVGFVDYSACVKILSRTSKYVLMMLCLIISGCEPNIDIIRHLIWRNVIRYHTKRFKNIIRNCSDNKLFILSGHLL